MNGATRNSIPRARLLPHRVIHTILGVWCLLVVSAIAAIVVLYPDGISSWDHGHLTISLDR